MTKRPFLARSLLALLCLSFASCTSYPDKRQLQYLNSQGFGKRYTGNAEEENYITIGDTLQVTDAFNDEELGLNAEVDIDGTVLLPELGPVPVAGLTRSEIEGLLMERYSAYYDLLDIHVQIQTAGKRYYIFGEVKDFGAKPFPGDMTVFEALIEAAPIRETANTGRVRLIRADPNDPLVLVLDMSEMMESGDSTFNVHVQENDIIFVPATLLAQFGYFLDTLLFPVKLVLTGLSNAFFSVFAFGQGGPGNRSNSFF